MPNFVFVDKNFRRQQDCLTIFCQRFIKFYLISSEINIFVMIASFVITSVFCKNEIFWSLIMADDCLADLIFVLYIGQFSRTTGLKLLYICH